MNEFDRAAMEQICKALPDAVPSLQGRRVLLMHGVPVPDVAGVFSAAASVSAVQPFYPFAQGLKHHVPQVDLLPSLSGAGDAAKSYDVICVKLPKNMDEAKTCLLQAAAHIAPDGVMIVSAHNKAGGSRLQKMLQAMGAADMCAQSGQKCKTYWCRGDQLQKSPDLDTHADGLQRNAAGYYSWPGIYGWDKIDKGSALLAQILPHPMKGRRGADFGCGYGYLSMEILKGLAPPYKYYVLDADQRALTACEANLQPYQDHIVPIWCDITDGGSDFPKNLDFIVMNPPFHEGKKADISIGKRFIAQAARSLRAGGALWMVANVQLPYEQSLQAHFTSVEKLHEGQGFKIYRAVK